MSLSGSTICIIQKVTSEKLNRSLSGIPLREKSAAIADQIHSPHVEIVTHGGVYKETDGFVTIDEQVALAIRVADCVPVIIRSRSGRIRGLIHAGRDGIASGIIESMIDAVDAVREFNDPFAVFLGPHIGPCCYRFPADHPVGRRLISDFPDGSRIADGCISLDLTREIRGRIRRSGFDFSSVVSDSRCTACSAGKLPSHKREGIHRNRSLLIISTSSVVKKELISMAVDPELLKILACPETKEPVHLAPDTLVDRLNELIDSGSVKNRGGEEVTEKIDAGLVREDKRYLYPIRDDIPIMLIEEAIELPSLDLTESV